jgi:four helix bundle protein
VNQADSLGQRTFRFALRIVAFCRTIPRTWDARRIGEQLLDSGTSVGANYRAACRARSRAEFIAKLGIVLEEADETVYWLTVVKQAGIADGADLNDLLVEARELLAIFCASCKTAREHRQAPIARK